MSPKTNYMNRVFYLVFSILLFTSCKKNSSSSPSCTLSVATVAGTYKFAAYTTQQSASSPVIDTYATWSACDKNDLLTLNANGTYQRVDGCFPSSIPITGTWSLNGNILTSDGSPATATFDCHILILNSNTYPKETITLVKQ